MSKSLAVFQSVLFLLVSAAPIGPSSSDRDREITQDEARAALAAPMQAEVAPAPPPVPKVEPPPPPPPTPEEALERGVLIVVSIPSQQAFVFKRGEIWDSTEVSTGKPGNDTPTGTFPILQKKVDHRSTLYDDAPMPYMQRLTWDGVALHAGRVPGYPASHGCIRLPKAFAKKLYGITNHRSVVIVTEEEVSSAKAARKAGLAQAPAEA